MNRFLATILGYLNGFIAFILVIAGIAVGYILNKDTGQIFLVPLGAIGGLLVAVIWCGVIAVIVDIRNLLMEISDALQNSRNMSGLAPSPRPTERVEPRMDSR